MISNLKKLFQHSSSYLIGQILLMIAGFISFPIYTRILSIAEYGLLGLITATIAFAVAISKMGLQHSIIRFYSEYQASGNSKSISVFYSTFFLSNTAISAFVCIVFYLGLKVFPDNIIDSDLSRLLGLTSILILFGCTIQTFGQFFRAEQKPFANIFLTIVSRYGALACSLLFFFFSSRNLDALFIGRILWQALVFIWLLIFFIKTRYIKIKNFSWPLLRDSFRYGLPLIATELSHIVLHLGDNYIILHFMGPVALGIYAVGYSLATYISQLITIPVRDAILPIYVNIWEKKGRAETVAFLSNSLKYYLLLGIPAIFGVIAVSQELITIFATSKYASATDVVPYVITGLFAYGAWGFFGAGLFLYKKTSTISVLMILSTLVNIGLNFILIPMFGIVGAAIATLSAYVFYILVLAVSSFTRLSFSIPYANLLLYLVFSLVMYGFIFRMSIDILWINIFVKIFSGCLIYAALIFIFQKQERDFILKAIRSRLL